MKTLKELAVDHDYYCSDNNYYSNSAGQEYPTWRDFHNVYHDADIDMNLIFRWDIKQHDGGDYYCEIFIMHQRKGKFSPVMIESFVEEDIPSFMELVTEHWKKLVSIWKPISI